MISKQQIFEELLVRKNSLYNPFPYDDTDKIQIDFNLIRELEEVLTSYPVIGTP